MGNGSQTPARTSLDDGRPNVINAYGKWQPQRAELHQHHFEFWKNLVPLSERVVLLFIFGVAYGVIISHLHNSQQVTPVQVDLRGIEHNSWGYLVGWGGVGVLIGGLLPWVDLLWEDVLGNSKDAFVSQSLPERPVSPASGEEADERSTPRSGSGLGADWNPVVRGIGAFVGIAFAIVSTDPFHIYYSHIVQRKLPWQSTSQVSLTLALVNPVLWYLVDRSKPGFLLSMLVGLAGTAIAFGFNPEIVPSPATPSPRAGSMTNISQDYGVPIGLISNESVGVGTWIASVLFCSSVCFGNIGRRLALGTGNRKPSIS